MPYQSYKSYESFDLSIEQYGDKYRSRARSSQGEDRVDFELPFTAKELRSITWLDGALFRHVRLRPDGQEPIQELSPKQFGTRLFDTVFAGEVGRLYSSTLTALHAQNNLPPIGLRIRLRLNDAPELAVWPWEYLYNDNDFLALSEETPIVRYLEMAKPPQPLEIEPPLQILVVVSAPKDVQTLQVEKEWQ